MKLLRDKEVADLLGLSAAWVRGQRHKRKTGQEHSFDLDAIFIGRAARYKEDEVREWYADLRGEPPEPLRALPPPVPTTQVPPTDNAVERAPFDVMFNDD